MSPKHFQTADEADRRVIRSTILTCVAGGVALALFAQAFAARNDGAESIAPAPTPTHAVPTVEPVAPVAPAVEALSTAPWRPEVEIGTSSG